MADRVARRRITKTLALGLGLVGLICGAWLLTPRSYVYDLRSADRVTAEWPDSDAVPLVDCMENVVGVKTRTEAFIVPFTASTASTPDRYVLRRSETRRDGPDPATVGRFEITRPWFGAYAYVYIAEDGTRVPLERNTKWPACIVESL